jgi:glyoxylase-like metal-dependent hydrolase (beta-lactamase superfamily II)
MPGLRIVRGAVNTAVFERQSRKLAIDTGDLASLTLDWALYTHHHRDQASAASLLATAGARIAVPAAEAKLFTDAYEFWMGSTLSSTTATTSGPACLRCAILCRSLAH